MKNKQIQLAALTVAVAAGVMVQPVKAHAEGAPETEAAVENESTSAQEQAPEAAEPAQSSEEIVAGNEDIADANADVVTDNASKDEAQETGAETPAESDGETGSSEDGTPEEKDAEDTDASKDEETEADSKADAEEKDADASEGDSAEKDEASDTKETTPADKKQQGDAVIAAGDKVKDLGQSGSSVTDYSDAVKDQNDAAKDYNDTVTKENESKTDDEELTAAKDALDAAQKEVEKAQEAVDAATSIEERNALIEKLNEAVQKQNEAAKAYSDRVNALQDAKKDEVTDSNKDQLGKNDGTLKDNQAAQDTNEAAGVDADPDVAKAKEELAQKEELLNSAKSTLEALENATQEEYDAAVRAYNDALNAYNAAADKYNDKVNAYKEKLANEAASKNDKYGKLDKDNADKNKELEKDSADNPTVDSAADNENTLGGLQDELDKITSEDNELAEIKEGLTKQKEALLEQIDKIKGIRDELEKRKDAADGGNGTLDSIKAYNDTVDDYNKEIEKYTSLIGTYNEFVLRYNNWQDKQNQSASGKAEWGNITTDSIAFNQFYNQGTLLSHLDVKFDAAEDLKQDETGKWGPSGGTANGYNKVVGIYKSEEVYKKHHSWYGLNYKQDEDSASAGLSLSKNDYEFTVRNDSSLKLDKDTSTISFYIVMKNDAGETTGFNVSLDATKVYPEGTYYGGNKAYSLANYKDDEHPEGLPTITKDGKTYYDISGLSIYAVSAMTCDRFFWGADDARQYEKDNKNWYVSKDNCDTRLQYEDWQHFNDGDYMTDKDGNPLLLKPNGLDLVLNLDTLIALAQQNNIKTLKYLGYEQYLTPKTKTEALAQLTGLTDYSRTDEAGLNEVLQQMKQLQQELDIPETPDDSTPDPIPVPVPVTPEAPVAPGETPETPVSPAEVPTTPAEAAETPAADTPVMPGNAQNPVENARIPQAPGQSVEDAKEMLPQTGVNRAGVLGLALAGFSFLTAGLGMELSARRCKHCKH